MKTNQAAARESDANAPSSDVDERVSGVRARRSHDGKHAPVEVETYGRDSAVRAAIEDADVLLFRGETLTSRLIEIGTDGVYSHAALAFRAGDRVKFVEAVGAGVREGLLSEEVATYDGAVELWRLKDEYRPRFHAARAIAEAEKYLGRPYNMTAVWRFVLDWATFHLLPHARSGARSHRAFFCSQLVARAYAVGGVVLDRGHTQAGTSPSDLARGKHLEPIRAFARAEAPGVDVALRV
ncbi:MAG: hypothetical protein NVSMB47_22620 [Polyangiales bacterium]